MSNKIYDIIILGGGIAGIYTTYKLLQKNPSLSILLLESSDRFGGRIHTITKYGIEAGAGRFSSKHRHLLQLINELGFEDKKIKLTSSFQYFPSREKDTHSYDLQELIEIIIAASKLEKITYLQTVSLTEYAETIFTKEEVQYIHDSFGYYSELVIMNAHDAIQLMKQLNEKNTFYSLQGGLSQIIEAMMEKIKQIKPNQQCLKKNHQVIDINRETDESFYSVFTENNKIFQGNKIIAALPKQVIENITVFKILKPYLKKIECAPLCRIYSKFAPIKGKQWFEDISKFTTNNNIRMVIPINREKGMIMISYTDNKYAKYWNALYEKEGIKKVNEQLAKYMRESIQIEIPKPIETMVYYWPCGVGYWGIDADSHEISQLMKRPFEDEEIYICGEHYSEKNQQWIEGALETSLSILDLLFKKK
jgi:protoporphyrinogen oxidase